MQHKQVKYQIAAISQSNKLDKYQLQYYNKCLKWRPLISSQQRRRLCHW